MKCCPACARTHLHTGPASRTTGWHITSCRDCGAHYWADSWTTEDAPHLVGEDEFSSADYSDWVALKRDGGGPDAWRATTQRLRNALSGVPKPLVYDVGAGDGGYLALARDEFGCEVTGNEIVAGAVALAQERNAVTLELGELTDLEHHEEFDAVTLWCVLAHVPDGDQLLRDSFTALKPGGMLYLQTPRWSAADRAGNGVKRLTGGRISALPDRRIAQHHRILHTARSITAQLERAGFTEIAAEPAHRFPLTSYAYLASMNPPGWSLGPASWLMDRIIESPAAPRIVLDVYARRPH